MNLRSSEATIKKSGDATDKETLRSRHIRLGGRVFGPYLKALKTQPQARTPQWRGAEDGGDTSLKTTAAQDVLRITSHETTPTRACPNGVPATDRTGLWQDCGDVGRTGAGRGGGRGPTEGPCKWAPLKVCPEVSTLVPNICSPGRPWRGRMRVRRGRPSLHTRRDALTALLPRTPCGKRPAPLHGGEHTPRGTARPRNATTREKERGSE